MLRRAFPRGVPQCDYAPLLVVLGSELSEGNLAAVMAELVDGEIVVIENDAAAAMSYRRPQPGDVIRVREYLEESGWKPGDTVLRNRTIITANLGLWCGAPSSSCGQGHSHGGCGWIEAGWVELSADLGVGPGFQLVVFFVGRVGEDLLELLVARVAAAVLGWAGAFAFEAGRVGLASFGLGGRFDEQLVHPAIAEVILVADTVTHAGHIDEPDRALIPVSQHVLRISPVSQFADPEHVQVAVLPAYGALDHIVQLAQ
jgi:Protein of unknown function (DUF3349)